MKYFVKWEVHEDVEADEVIMKQLEHIEKSGKLKEGGVLLGIRGGYFLFDIEKPGELLGLLGKPLWDNCYIESHPIVSYNELTDFLKVEHKKAA